MAACRGETPRVDGVPATPAPAQRDATLTWLLGPTPAQDFLHATDSHDALVARLGAAIVVRDSVDVGEGMKEFGTIVYPADSTRRLEILWADTARFRTPKNVFVSGARSTWRVYPGVGIGTGLATVDSLNGRAFVLAGFGWDYSGTVYSYEGGRLDSLWGTRPGRHVMLRLAPDSVPDALMPQYNQVMGDSEYRSDLPAMRAVRPRVYQIIVGPR